jgi:hypothetical protein
MNRDKRYYEGLLPYCKNQIHKERVLAMLMYSNVKEAANALGIHTQRLSETLNCVAATAYHSYIDPSILQEKSVVEPRADRSKRILVIPDTQCKPNGDITHIKAAANFAVRKQVDIIVTLGDWWDMESLSVYNTRKQSEGLRIKDDVEAGMDAMNAFMDIINKGFSKKPRLVFTHGNHSMQVRLPRFIESNPHLDGMIEESTTPFLERHGFEVYPFLEVVNIEGIRFSHYIQNPHSLRGGVLAGTIDNMLKNAGFSFVMGHQQVLKMGKHYLSDGTMRLGLVAGAFYPHEESYMSVQGNRHWRGIVLLNEVKEGAADICEVSLDYLLRKYNY